MAAVTLRQIARMAHELDRIHGQHMGLIPVDSWEDLTSAFQDKRVELVQLIWKDRAGSKELTPADLHTSWMADGLANGWRHGATYDPQAKTHPFLVPFAELSPHEQLRLHLFVHLVTAYYDAYAAKGGAQ